MFSEVFRLRVKRMSDLLLRVEVDFKEARSWG